MTTAYLSRWHDWITSPVIDIHKPPTPPTHTHKERHSITHLSESLHSQNVGLRYVTNHYMRKTWIIIRSPVDFWCCCSVLVRGLFEGESMCHMYVTELFLNAQCFICEVGRRQTSDKSEKMLLLRVERNNPLSYWFSNESQRSPQLTPAALQRFDCTAETKSNYVCYPEVQWPR